MQWAATPRNMTPIVGLAVELVASVWEESGANALAILFGEKETIQHGCGCADAASYVDRDGRAPPRRQLQRGTA